MAVRQQQYTKELEKQLDKGVSFEKAHEAAVKKSTVKITPKKKKKDTWVSRLKRNVEMIIKGPKYYSSKKKKSTQPKETARTKTIKRGLSSALSKEEIAKLKGKK